MRSAPEMSGLLGPGAMAIWKHALVPAQSIAEGGRLCCAIAAGGMAGRPASSPRHAVARAWPCCSRRHDPGGSIENGVLHIEKLEAAAPTGAEDLVLDLKQIPPTRITDLLLEVDAATGFTEAFTHLRTGAPLR